MLHENRSEGALLIISLLIKRSGRAVELLVWFVANLNLKWSPFVEHFEHKERDPALPWSWI